MTRTRIKLAFVLLLFISIKGYAQQSCYQIGLVEGRGIFTDAQKLEKNGKYVEAVPRYWEALRRFRLTRSCRDLPSNHELDSWEDKCIQGVTACGGKSNESTYLMASPQSLAFDENGGERTITISTNSDAWRIERTPSWCVSQKNNNRLIVKCKENVGTSNRRENLVVVAGTLRYEIAIEQAGKTSLETPASASIKITDVRFAGKYADGATSGYGEKLSVDMTFLLPQITCDHLVMESKKIKLGIKILDPNGKLLSGTGSGYTWSEEITSRGNLQKNDVFDVSQWGDGNGTTFATTGKYAFEIWCSGVNMFSTSFEVFPKSVPPCESIKITEVQMKGKYADNTTGDYGLPLYNHMTFLLPRITGVLLTEESKTIKFDFSILDPDGRPLASTSGGSWQTEITFHGSINQSCVFDVQEWGSNNAVTFSKTGIYQFQILCSGVSLFKTSFEVESKQKPVQIPSSTSSTSSSSAAAATSAASRIKVGVGVKAGLNLVHVADETWADMRPDFHAGILLNLNFGHKGTKPGFFSLQPEVLYSRQGFAMDGEAVNLDYIMIPLMFKIYAYQGFNIEVGPWGSYLVSVNPDSKAINGMNIKLSDLKGGKDVGIAAGIGYDFNSGLVIGARYQHGLSEMASNVSWTNRVISISLGWKF